MRTVRNLISPLGVAVLCSMLYANDASRAADTSTDRPLIAVWREHDGLDDSETPYLRVAIWSDGTVLFADDPTQWSHKLRRGTVSEATIAELRKGLAESGVFDLKGTCYLVPDAPVDCIVIDLGEEKQMLYWDEVDSPNYGIGGSTKPQHRDFIKCWKAVNRLAVSACPKQSELEKKQFEGVPRLWYLREAIQSE